MITVLTLIGIVAVLTLLAVILWKRKNRNEQALMEQHAIAPEELHSLLDQRQDIALFDVRQPLDLLAHSEIIPGARRIPPAEVLATPTLIPKDQEAIVYCTCPGDKTSREILHRALNLHFSRVKFLKGGLEGWKAKGYPVEPYREVFHLYTPNLARQ